MICPECGEENRVGVQVCSNCGVDLYQTLLDMISTKQLSSIDTRDIGGEDVMSPTSNPIVIYVSSSDANPIAVERHAEVLIGRIDPNNPAEMVDLDLEPFHAQEAGVSRNHAVLLASQQPPELVDLGSYNGTFINGQKLTPEQRHPLQSGDEIRLAQLVMRIYFKS